MQHNPKDFEFTSYYFNPQKKVAIFNYRINFTNKKSLLFSEKIVFPKKFSTKTIPKQLLENALNSVHMMLGISYYKLYCPSKIILKKQISKEQAEFWNVVYKKGLGEFFYQNKIDPQGLINFPYDKKAENKSYSLESSNRMLIGIGGGKDSIVAVEILKEQKKDITAFIVETQKNSPISDKIVDVMDVPSLKISRLIDEKIFAQHESAYNGHIPVSMVFAFLGYLSALLYDYSYIAVANEYSSNFGNIKYKGLEINHQWSKSMEAEKLFQDYANNFLCPDIKYFSLLRPFYEIRIVEMFAKYKKYFPYFSSCNNSFKVHKKRQDRLWCCECAKCVFVFTLLSAYLTKKELLGIFGKNLYEDKKLLPMFQNVLGFGKMKPFDCVGTFEESQAALYLARKKFKNSLILKNFLPKIKDGEGLVKKVLAENDSSTLPTQFKFSGVKNALIMGYGKEGKITQKYLKKKFPNLKIGIADQKNDKNYLLKQKDYDIAIKTPGISKYKMTIPYTTATNIFFSQVKNTIIGITGSKGKSTTASLIYTILKESGKNISLIGNIGNPMLEVLLRPIQKYEIFVVEISSYQLDDIKFSPNISVTLNLFPEHMNYHGNEEKYYKAKYNITNFQKESDVFIYNKKYKKLREWAEETKAKALPFVDIARNDFKSDLLGEHNRENISAAITVAKQFDISDNVIKRALEKFKPLSHRLEFIGEFRGIKFYDDAISTTPESTIMAIKTLSNVGTIFLGGEDRGYDFSELEKQIKKHKIKNIVLFPESGKRILKSKKGVTILETSDMKQAVEFAYQHTPQGAICLLSTASPSYSVWKNFEEKGNLFNKFVKKYGKTKK